MTFDDFKEGFVAVLSQAIEQLSSSEDEEQPSDSTAGVMSFALIEDALMLDTLYFEPFCVTTA